MRYYLWLIMALTTAVSALAANTSPDMFRIMATRAKVTAAPATGVKTYLYAAYSTSQGKVFRLVDTDSVLELGGVATTAPDGTRRLNVRNSVSRTYTPVEGDLDTDADGKLWIYTAGQWVENGAAAPIPGSSGYVSAPTYSDETCTVGQWSVASGYRYDCLSTNTWDRYAVTYAGWSNPTPPPPVTSEILRANGGGTASWTASSGAYPAHNTDIADDSELTYISTATPNTFEKHTFADTSNASPIASVKMYVRAKASVAGDKIRPYVDNAGTTSYWPTDLTATTEYATYSHTWTVNPHTSAAWTTTTVNAYSYGLRSFTSLSGTVYVSDYWIEVTYE